MKQTVESELSRMGLEQDDMKARWVGAIMALVGLIAPWIFQGELPDPTAMQDLFISFVSMVLNGGGAWLITYYKNNFVKPLLVALFALPLLGCGGNQFNVAPLTPEELGQIVRSVETLGYDNFQLIKDDEERAKWELICVALVSRIQIESVPNLAAFCEPVVEAAE